jgi:hypothetical protein
LTNGKNIVVEIFSDVGGEVYAKIARKPYTSVCGGGGIIFELLFHPVILAKTQPDPLLLLLLLFLKESRLKKRLISMKERYCKLIAQFLPADYCHIITLLSSRSMTDVLSKPNIHNN